MAKLTLTPQYELRCLSDRVQLILDLPEYHARYGGSVPEVDFVGLIDGAGITRFTTQTIRVEAVKPGPDGIVGTVDDGSVRSVKLYLNGTELPSVPSAPVNGIYDFSWVVSQPSGTYVLEAVAEDSDGFRSRVRRNVVIKGITISGVGSLTPSGTITSPEPGTIFNSKNPTRCSERIG